MITVYRVQAYDISTDNYRGSRRYWTKSGADATRMDIIDGTSIEIPLEHLIAGEQFTEIDYSPARDDGDAMQWTAGELRKR